MNIKTFPWFPLASAAAAGLGLFGLYWYENLPPEDKSEIDERTADCARNLHARLTGEPTDLRELPD